MVTASSLVIHQQDVQAAVNALWAGGAEAMMKKDGCAACHSIDKKIVGPAYVEVAAKYKGDKTAAANLTQTVLKGSNPYESHWKGKASGLAMPPNAVAIKEAEAKKLVAWILALPAAKP